MKLLEFQPEFVAMTQLLFRGESMLRSTYFRTPHCTHFCTFFYEIGFGASFLLNNGYFGQIGP
jgi:hypothetical protein